MIDAKELLDSLTVDDIKTLITELGAQHIEDYSETKGHLITNTICHNISDGKMKLYYYTEDKDGNPKGKFHCYTACGDSFNIYELIERNFSLKNIPLKFNEIINWICSKLGIENSGYSKPDGFGHLDTSKVNEELEYLKKFDRKKIEPPELKVFDERILYKFSDYKHPSWIEDGISEEAMSKYGIKYDYVNQKIIVPHRYYKDNSLIGIKVRTLNSWEIEKGFKYVPYQTFGDNPVLYSYPTYFNLYGYYQNRDYIKKIKKILLLESEKSVMQVESIYGSNNFSSALSGSNMSWSQAEILINDGIEEVILGLDKEFTDIDTPQGKSYIQKILKIGRMLAPYMRVAILVDSLNLLELKDSPTDKGKEVLEKLMENKRYIELVSE